ncbi:MAG: hypothetical protein FRX48_07824 [Lasallia pustulata]|uniref:Uncharacterized protein n=1 Tax=Lasallia pustulata TaxID=136370 RepID=A0A5M8PG62_9LECA|nr:MAG: hypothetical protein FRX48_07824 [Lasallia pustulata]
MEDEDIIFTVSPTYRRRTVTPITIILSPGRRIMNSIPIWGTSLMPSTWRTSASSSTTRGCDDRRSNNRIKGDCYPYNNHFVPGEEDYEFDPYMGDDFNAFDLLPPVHKLPGDVMTGEAITESRATVTPTTTILSRGRRIMSSNPIWGTISMLLNWRTSASSSTTRGCDDRRSNNRIKGDCYPYNNHFAPKKATFKFDPYMGNGFNAFGVMVQEDEVT